MFKPLYARASNGKTKVWSIDVKDLKTKGAEIIVTHGYIDGKMVQNSQVITEGKNIGRSNETTPLEQATKEAKAKYQKKLDEEYSESSTHSSHASSIQPPLPMLAQSFEKRGHDIEFPCFCQPKLDGVRGIWFNNTLYSRNAKEFPHLNHIKKSIRILNPHNLILDGELYSHTLTFQEVVGLVKKQTLSETDIKKMQQIEFIVYDYISDDDFKDRLKTLQKLFKSTDVPNVSLLETDVCEREEDVYEFLKKYEDAGYEGLILRNKKGPYVTNYRSENLQKLKSFQDAEFEIIGYTEGVGLEEGLIIFICQTKTGHEFRVRPAMTHEERAKMFKKGKSFIGKLLTVKFQTLTNDGIPRFPIGLSVRDYE